MITVQNVIDVWLTPELIAAMGECAYQRLIYTLGTALPCLYLAFAVSMVFLLLYSIYRLVIRK